MAPSPDREGGAQTVPLLSLWLPSVAAGNRRQATAGSPSLAVGGGVGEGASTYRPLRCPLRPLRVGQLLDSLQDALEVAGVEHEFGQEIDRALDDRDRRRLPVALVERVVLAHQGAEQIVQDEVVALRLRVGRRIAQLVAPGRLRFGGDPPARHLLGGVEFLAVGGGRQRASLDDADLVGDRRVDVGHDEQVVVLARHQIRGQKIALVPGPDRDHRDLSLSEHPRDVDEQVDVEGVEVLALDQPLPGLHRLDADWIGVLRLARGERQVEGRVGPQNQLLEPDEAWPAVDLGRRERSDAGAFEGVRRRHQLVPGRGRGQSMLGKKLLVVEDDPVGDVGGNGVLLPVEGESRR